MSELVKRRSRELDRSPFRWQKATAAGFLAGCFALGSVIAGATGGEGGEGASFVDSTATITNRNHVTLGKDVYVGPFAHLISSNNITIGDESNVQDNVVIDASQSSVELGKMAILAHGAAVKNGTRMGTEGKCPAPVANAHADPHATGHGAADEHCPSFVGFNSVVEGAILEMDTMVMHLAYVGPGVRIPSGRKVNSGMRVDSQLEVMSKTAPLVAGDRTFMDGVIEVNVSFAGGYSRMHDEDHDSDLGVNYDAGMTKFNPFRDLPELAGVHTRNTKFRNRIIGDVRMGNSLDELDRVMGNHISIRADEGEPFLVGKIASMGDGTVFHALEGSHIQAHDGVIYGEGVIVHGGGTPWNDVTIIGKNVRIGDHAVFFRSNLGNDSYVGSRALLQDTKLPAGSVIPDNWVVVNGQFVNRVEW
ncbi:hypothetical protein LBMAG38_16010 [Chloroflexota bacterium]|nr:hypothetical protein LBMAG38_16010 [Chloroflexota bacterium]